MQELGLAEVRARLSELVTIVQTHHDHVVVTKNGRPAAVLVSAEEWEEIEETAFWRAEPDILEDVARARGEIARGDYVTGEVLRHRYLDAE